MEIKSGRDWRRRPIIIDNTFVYPLGLFIRDILTKEGESSPYEIYKRLKSLKRIHEDMPRFSYNYQYIRNNFYYLRHLGFITLSRTEISSRPNLQPKRYYRLTPKGERAFDEWFNPLEEYRRMEGHL